MSLRSAHGCAATLTVLLLVGCRNAASRSQPEAAASGGAVSSLTPSGKAAPSARASRVSRLTVGWDPATGKGDVVHHFASGDYLRTCFHCGFEGYTGGLVIGNYGGSGMGFFPARPIRGHRQINVVCAQDESIWDRDERREYTYGWSENYGQGSDGVRLEYVRGKVVEETPDRVTLAARNEGGCYTVDKVVTTGAGDRYWVLATRITNRCDHPIHFDFFTGDDPWIGLYRTAAGDVGWTPAGIVRRETAFLAGQLTVAGMYDLGNAVAGEHEGDFTGQADFFALDPALPLPDFSAIANSFAHEPRDVDPNRPLDDQTITAVNLGWRKLRLAPGEGAAFAFALGLAEVGERVVEQPRVPAIPLADWSRWRSVLDAERGTRRRGIDFAAERVELELTASAFTVRARYLVENHDRNSTAIIIRYPIVVDRTQAPPADVKVDGKVVPVVVTEKGVDARFPVTVPVRGLAGFEIEYTQAITARRATYLVTSALTWAYPIGRAELVVRYPKSLGAVKLSYPVSFERGSDHEVVATVVRQPFVPDRELVATW
ncbi:MAG: hypothetical protein JW751_16290 [Polyangiaceae bacterium]|nr:hypothetical protein [Polyangiaceae bacterium]